MILRPQVLGIDAPGVLYPLTVYAPSIDDDAASSSALLRNDFEPRRPFVKAPGFKAGE
jgi:hypothetical protein